jgi:hypothetical protein
MSNPQPLSADDLLTNTAISVLARVGFRADMNDRMDRHICVLTRDGKQFHSRPHPTRAGAVSEAADQAAQAGRVERRRVPR